MATKDQTDELILALCRECGDEGDDEDLIAAFWSGHDEEDIEAAALGDVGAIARLRDACGLPVLV